MHAEVNQSKDRMSIQNMSDARNGQLSSSLSFNKKNNKGSSGDAVCAVARAAYGLLLLLLLLLLLEEIVIVGSTFRIARSRGGNGGGFSYKYSLECTSYLGNRSPEN